MQGILTASQISLVDQGDYSVKERYEYSSSDGEVWWELGLMNSNTNNQLVWLVITTERVVLYMDTPIELPADLKADNSELRVAKELFLGGLTVFFTSNTTADRDDLDTSGKEKAKVHLWEGVADGKEVSIEWDGHRAARMYVGKTILVKDIKISQ